MKSTHSIIRLAIVATTQQPTHQAVSIAADRGN
jgi:hypothetical protein